MVLVNEFFCAKKVVMLVSFGCLHRSVIGRAVFALLRVRMK